MRVGGWGVKFQNEKKKLGLQRGKNKVNLPITLGQKRKSHQCTIHPGSRTGGCWFTMP